MTFTLMFCINAFQKKWHGNNDTVKEKMKKSESELEMDTAEKYVLVTLGPLFVGI